MNMRLSILLLVLLALVLAACSQQAQAINSPLPPESSEEAACPTPTSDMRLLTDAGHGYCLLYPVTHKVEKPNANEIVLVIGGLLNASDPRVHIVAEEAGGRTAAEAAAEIEAAMTGFDIQRSSTELGGTEAIVLDKVPGQELNRHVFFVHDGLLYHLTFSPADENAGKAFTGMEALYNLVVDSFTFIPVADDVAHGEDCLEAKADERPLTFETYNFCMLVPTGYDVDEAAENQVTLYVGSLMDVEHPKAFINVEDAAGRTAEQAAEGRAAEIEAVMPGFSLERSFGLTVGYEPAWVLENVPAQDISRQVFVVHEGLLYTLTFVPADPSMGDVYTQMEELYATVVNSFRFLR
jgi:hypothetical protein